MADENTRQKSNLNENEQKTSEIDCQTEKCTPSVDKELDDLLDSKLNNPNQYERSVRIDLDHCNLPVSEFVDFCLLN